MFLPLSLLKKLISPVHLSLCLNLWSRVKANPLLLSNTENPTVTIKYGFKMSEEKQETIIHG